LLLVRLSPPEKIKINQLTLKHKLNSTNITGTPASAATITTPPPPTIQNSSSKPTSIILSSSPHANSNNNNNHTNNNPLSTTTTTNPTTTTTPHEEPFIRRIKEHRAVFSRSSTTFQDSPKQPIPKSPTDKEFIVKALEDCYLFAGAEQRETVADFCIKEEPIPGCVIVKQGDEGNKFYIIQSGTFSFYVNDKLVGTTDSERKTTKYFGELALLYNSPRLATVVCESNQKGQQKPILWSIDSSTFKSVLASQAEQLREQKRKALETVPLLNGKLTTEQMNRIIEAVELLHFFKGEEILKKGAKGDTCFFIQKGIVECTRIGPTELGRSELGPGMYFGERALLREEPRTADVTALTDVVVMALDRGSFEDILGPLRGVLDERMKESVMQSLPFLAELSPLLRSEILKEFQLETFIPGNIIVKAGDVADKFYVIRTGSVLVVKEDPSSSSSSNNNNNNYTIVATLGEGGWFGEMALQTDDVRAATCIADPSCGDIPVECFVLPKASFIKILNNSKILSSTSAARRAHNKALLEKNHHSGAIATTTTTTTHQTSSTTIGSLSITPIIPNSSTTTTSPHNSSNSSSIRTLLLPSSSSVLLDNDRDEETATLEELEKIVVLGKGTFGTVYLVRKIQQPQDNAITNRLYALKQLSKNDLVRAEQRSNVFSEKLLLEECHHPFILRLYRTYQDRDCLYMLLEFVQGGELFSVMQAKFRFPLYPTFFYTANVVECFDYLHSIHVVYRDLKPENILLDRFGYVKLADFGFAKKLTEGRKTQTLCGTPEYLAPEVLTGKGHDKGVDVWSLGILIFEMLVGMSPFATEYDQDPQTVTRNIIQGHVPWDRLARAVLETEAEKDPFWKNPPDGSLFSTTATTTLVSPSNNHHILNGSSSPSEMIRKSFTSSGSSNRKTSNANSSPFALTKDLVQKLLIQRPEHRLGNMRGGIQDIKKHPYFAKDIVDWSLLRERKIPAPYVPELENELDTSKFDEFEPGKVLPYKGNQDWCKDFA
jgi:serine/threonine protein kinase/CRP-like cAMP-binding protein